jgi:4-diphosphocytidyl-2-C-methyl-D-erythritol kinase
VKLRTLAPAKVNLSLFLGPTRADGRHELVTLFQSLSLADEVLLETGVDSDQVICPGVGGSNLAAAALAALRARGWDGPALRLSIRKRIPVAGGMGGGSADAAAVLRLAGAVTQPAHPVPNLRPEELDLVAMSLGADVPSQLVSGVAVGTGAGDLVERFAPLAPHAYVILPAGFPLATPAVYAEADRLGLGRPASELRDLYAALVKTLGPGGLDGAVIPEELLVNDLQEAALSLRPAIAGLLEALSAAGAEQVLVSGSGPTTIGIRWGEGALDWASKAADELRASHPGAVAAGPVNADFAMPELA